MKEMDDRMAEMFTIQSKAKGQAQEEEVQAQEEEEENGEAKEDASLKKNSSLYNTPKDERIYMDSMDEFIPAGYGKTTRKGDSEPH
jgi:hypothetical protein